MHGMPEPNTSHKVRIPYIVNKVATYWYMILHHYWASWDLDSYRNLVGFQILCYMCTYNHHSLRCNPCDQERPGSLCLKQNTAECSFILKLLYYKFSHSNETDCTNLHSLNIWKKHVVIQTWSICAPKSGLHPSFQPDRLKPSKVLHTVCQLLWCNAWVNSLLT